MYDVMGGSGMQVSNTHPLHIPVFDAPTPNPLGWMDLTDVLRARRYSHVSLTYPRMQVSFLICAHLGRAERLEVQLG